VIAGYRPSPRRGSPYNSLESRWCQQPPRTSSWVASCDRGPYVRPLNSCGIGCAVNLTWIAEAVWKSSSHRRPLSLRVACSPGAGRRSDRETHLPGVVRPIRRIVWIRQRRCQSRLTPAQGTRLRRTIRAGIARSSPRAGPGRIFDITRPSRRASPRHLPAGRPLGRPGSTTSVKPCGTGRWLRVSFDGRERNGESSSRTLAGGIHGGDVGESI
jgi:hypothetical protein